MKKSWLWILVLLIVALALRGVKGTMNKAKDLVKDGANVVENVADGAADVISGAVDAVEDGAEAAADVVEGAVDAVEDGAEAIVDGAADVISGAVDVVEDGAEAIVDGTADVISGAVDAVEDGAEAVIDGAADVIKEGAEAVKEGADTVINAMESGVDLSKSSVKWTGRTGPKAHNGVIDIKSVMFDVENGAIKGGDVVIDMNTIKATDIDSEKLDNHLKAEDYFDVENYPTANLKITNVEGNTITADLTIKGKTNEVVFDIENKDNMISTQFSINSQLRDIVEGVQDAIVADDIDFDISLAF